MRLAGKHCVVAGTGPGTGQALVTRLLREGARVVALARTRQRLLELQRSLPAHTHDLAIAAADLATEAGASEAIATAQRFLGRIDGLVTNTGGFRAGTILDTDAGAFDEMMSTNTRAHFLVARAVAPLMAASHGGAMVLVAAVFGGVVATRNLLAYSAAKAATVAIGKSLAADLRAANIRVNVICPGAISHTCQPGAAPGDGRTLGDGPGRPEDIAAAAAFLLSDDAFWISGATLNVDAAFAVARDPW
ncbi:MAG: SDR family oxidoreductase [Planctomycetota bacterium]